MYKDTDKQKEANRLANKRYRDKLQGITQKVSREQGITRTRTEGCKCAIPGDEDYVGCVVDGKVVKPEPIPVKDMT